MPNVSLTFVIFTDSCFDVCIETRVCRRRLMLMPLVALSVKQFDFECCPMTPVMCMYLGQVYSVNCPTELHQIRQN